MAPLLFDRYGYCIGPSQVWNPNTDLSYTSIGDYYRWKEKQKKEQELPHPDTTIDAILKKYATKPFRNF